MIKKEDCNHQLDWYKKPRKEEQWLFTQNEWNSSLLTKINELSMRIHRSTYGYSANKLIVNPINEHIFLSIGWYVPSTKMLSGKYEIIYDQECEEDIIYVFSDSIEKEKVFFIYNNISVLINQHDNSNYEALSFRLAQNDNEISEIKKNMCGYIKIRKRFYFFEK